jgi:transketolase
MPSRRELANAVRALSMDAVQRANSGHPGAPMGMADIAEVLWNDYLKHDPNDPHWYDRDRFVLSNGHGSMLLYSLLHLTGYDLSIDDLKAFRQFGSRTAGHPESHLHPAIETTTGPLGQGLANAVGMALAEKVLAARYNRPGHEVVDHTTWVFAGDGCLMEGISHEACSLAGTLGLGKLILLYDDNGISIDGEVDGWFTDDTAERFRAYGWHVIDEVDGHDPDAIRRAIEVAQAAATKPSIICCRTIIGFGSPGKQGTSAAHGAALGEAEIAATREALGWSSPPFEIPEAIRSGWDGREAGAQRSAAWREVHAAWAAQFPELAAEYQRRMAGELPDGWAEHCQVELARLISEVGDVATRKSSELCLDALGALLPELLGGSADLTGSNNTWWSGSKAISNDDADGNYVFYGVREFGMSAIMNGLVLHGGFIPYGATFLTFADYARNALRMAALMGTGSIFVYTHDSIGLGEDGPTHQSVEHLASLRIIPRLELWRPCDTVETFAAWRHAIERRDGPTCMALTRQGLPAQDRDEHALAGIARGGYVLADCEGAPEAILIATGSEVGLAMAARAQMTERGRRVRVVSMPCNTVFDAQDQAYRDAVLPPSVLARVAIEAGVAETWHRYVGSGGRILAVDDFGESAPAKIVFEHFGFTVDHVVELIDSTLD